jgi:hypothetical protein
MPSRQYHLSQDRKHLGKEFNEVHRILDQFSHYPNMAFLMRHRKFMHHEEGVEYIRMRFGDLAAESAIQHIKDDCNGYVPKATDYYDGTVDMFGCLTTGGVGYSIGRWKPDKSWEYEEI